MHDLTPETIARTPDDEWKLEICSAYGDNGIFVDRTTRSRVQDVPDMQLQEMRAIMTPEDASSKHLPGAVVEGGESEIRWKLDARGMEYAERMQVAITARRSLEQLLPDREVGQIRDSEDQITIPVYGQKSEA